jgi:site-specific recombinase XerD
MFALYINLKWKIWEGEMENKKKFHPDPQLKLMDQVRQVLHYHHYSYRTEKTYCNWIIRFLKFYHLKIHLREMGKNEIDAYLSPLATKANVSASTQKKAMNSILFLYREVLDIPIEEVIASVKSKKPRQLPVIMTHDEVKMVLVNLHGIHLILIKKMISIITNQLSVIYKIYI